MKTFEDTVRQAIEQAPVTLYNKEHALQLYVEQSVMDAHVESDAKRYKDALEQTGGTIGGIEPIHRFYEAFQKPVTTAHAAAALGLGTETFIQKISGNINLQSLGLQVFSNQGTIKRDIWTARFQEIVYILDFPDGSIEQPDDFVGQVVPIGYVYIPDPNLRTIIEVLLNKPQGAPITKAEMATLKEIEVKDKNISSMIGLECAINLTKLKLNKNAISDISPVANMKNLKALEIPGNPISDLSPIRELTQLTYIEFSGPQLSDISPIAGLVNLNRVQIRWASITDLSPLAGLTSLERLDLYHNEILVDISPVMNLTNLHELNLSGCHSIRDVSPIANLTNLKTIGLSRNVPDISSLFKLFPCTRIGWHFSSSLPSDVNEDGIINILDLVAVANDFGKSVTKESRTDINLDGVINILDLTRVATYFGATCEVE